MAEDAIASAFANNKFSLTRLGSWEVIDGGLLRLWCPDGEMRQRALLTRIGAYLDYRPDPNPQHVLDLADRIARQLGLDVTDLTTPRHHPHRPRLPHRRRPTRDPPRHPLNRATPSSAAGGPEDRAG